MKRHYCLCIPDKYGHGACDMICRRMWFRKLLNIITNENNMKIIKKIFQFLKLTVKRLISLFRKKPKKFTGEPCPIIVPGREPEIDKSVYRGLALHGHMNKRLLVRPVLAAELIGYGSYKVVAIGRDELCSSFTIGEIVYIREGKTEILINQDEIYIVIPYDIGFRETDS